MKLSRYQLSEYARFRRRIKYNASEALRRARLDDKKGGYVVYTFGPVTRLGKPANKSRVYDMSEVGGRLAKTCDIGWTFSDFGEAFTGCAVHLTHGRYLAGVCDPWENPPMVDVASVYDDEDDALRAGNEDAHIMAEKENEYQSEYASGQNARFEMREALEHVQNAKRALRAAIADCGAPSAAYALGVAKKELRDARMKRRDALDTLATLYDAGREGYENAI